MSKIVRVARIEQRFNRETGCYKYLRLEPEPYKLSTPFSSMAEARRLIREVGHPGVEYDVFVTEKV